MRLQLSTAILGFQSLVLCCPSAGFIESDATSVLDIRAAKRNSFPAIGTNTLAKPPSGFQVISFEAFMPSPDSDYNFSRTVFDIMLYPPTPGKPWKTTCWVHTNETLCNPDLWRSCDQVAGAGNENERLWFKLGHDLSSLDIKRRWTVQGMTLTATASEPATWKESVDPADGNVTVSEMGRFYERPNGWILPFKTLVG